MRQTTGTCEEASRADADDRPALPDPQPPDGPIAAQVVTDFAQLRRRLLALLAELGQRQETEAGTIRARMGLSDRSFGELWAACSCNGDLKGHGWAAAVMRAGCRRAEPPPR